MALLRSGRDRIELHPARCVLCATNWGTAWQYCIEAAEWRSLDYGILQTCGHAAIRFRVCSRAVEGSLTRPPNSPTLMLLKRYCHADAPGYAARYQLYSIQY